MEGQLANTDESRGLNKSKPVTFPQNWKTYSPKILKVLNLPRLVPLASKSKSQSGFSLRVQERLSSAHCGRWT